MFEPFSSFFRHWCAGEGISTVDVLVVDVDAGRRFVHGGHGIDRRRRQDDRPDGPQLPGQGFFLFVFFYFSVPVGRGASVDVAVATVFFFVFFFF